MSDDRPQISAFVARETKERLDSYARATGTKKGAVIEDALRMFLTEHDDLPAEYVLPAEITLSPESFERVAQIIEQPSKPTAALRMLMSSRERGSLG